MSRITIIIMLVTVFSKVIGFFRDIILSYLYGATNVTDAYLVSLSIPTAIFGFIGIGISTGYIPMISKIQQKHGEKESLKFTNNLVTILVILCSIICILGNIFIEEVVKLFASGFEGETLKLAIKFTRISLYGMYFTGIIYIYSGLLQVKGKYIVPALIGFPLNIVIILSLLLSVKVHVLILSIGTVIALASQLLFLIPFLYKIGYRFRFTFEIKNKYLIEMAVISVPLIIGISMNQINILIDRTLASQTIEGGISALNYANTLNGFVQSVLVMPLVTVMYPIISKLAVDNNKTGIQKAIFDMITGINLLVIPATVGFMFFAKPIVVMLFGRGAFDIQAANLTSEALFFFSIGMIGFGLREVLARVFYSMQDTKTPMINAGLGMFLNIVLNVILTRYMGIGGLALATSISAIVTTILMFFSLVRKIGFFNLKRVAVSCLKIVFASLIMGVITKLCFNSLSSYTKNMNLSLLISIVAGVFVYWLIIYFMRVGDLQVFKLLKDRVRKA
ncbi:murein biosynthesis integral membrane protein MurJ [Paenibacillus cymbidii]|uniref:murein biosynthesis integral membrane protein MurJ n=1 Tax=Paenibacillus cymbidii TaxID=1639034 RepID=UPI001080953B|nr:murein biosynthesis integral membrane protein MurJ [Paenibacillus cymbidii]